MSNINLGYIHTQRENEKLWLWLRRVGEYVEKVKNELCSRHDNIRIDGFGGVGWLVKMRMHACTDDSDGWDFRIVKRHMISTRKISIQFDLLC